MTELPPEQFRFTNHDGGIISTKLFLGQQSDFLDFLRKSIILGWSKDYTTRPREDNYAVMFSMDDNEEYWCHVPDYIFLPFLEDYNKG